MRLTTRVSLKACAWVVGALLCCPVRAGGEEIRVLFVPSRDLTAEAHRRALELALVEKMGIVRVVTNLVDAQVLLQITDYRVEHRKTGGPLRWWHGQVKILLSADATLQDVAIASRLPDRFALLVMGEPARTEMDHTVKVLENFLRRALRHDAKKHEGDTI
jgi:hypothetical protein